MQAEIFIKKILYDPDGGVSKLISLANMVPGEPGETDWLEFKAAVFPLDGKYTGTNKDYYSWNVAKAVIGMANTRGGVVLLGIDDDVDAVGLGPSDPENYIVQGGFDLFTRRTLKPALNPPTGKWNVMSGGKKSTVYSVENYALLEQCWEVNYHKYKERDVAAIIVKPILFGSENLIIIEDSANRSQILYHRQLGDTGSTESIWKREDIDHYIKTRTGLESHFDILYAKFFQPYFIEPAGLEKSIEKYISAASNSWTRKSCDDIDFIALDVCNIKHDIGRRNDHINKDLFHTRIFNPENMIDDGELFSDINRFVLTGLPGSGKTTALVIEFRKQIEQYNHGGKVVVFIKLENFNDKYMLSDFIKHETGFTQEEYEYLLKTDRFFLLLDGLNECPWDAQESCLRDIKNLTSNFRGISLVLTMRTRYWENQLDGLPVFEIMPVNKANREILFSRFLGNTREEAGKILTELTCKSGTSIIISNPLCLKLIAYIYKNHPAMELKNVSHLLNDFFKLWYDNTLSRNILESYESVLCKIARFSAFMRVAGFSKSVPFDWINKNIAKEWADEDGLIDSIAQGGIFQIDKKKKTFSFCHESFNEYFTAECFIRDPKFIAKFVLNEHIARLMIMPFIYSLELSDNKPSEYLLDCFSKIRNPLLMPFIIVFTSENRRFADQAFNNFRNKSFLAVIFNGRYHKRYKLLAACIKLFYGKKDIAINDLPSNDMMNLFTDKPWRYLIATHPLAKERWDKLIKNIDNPRLAISLVKYQLAQPGMFADKEETFIKKANSKEAFKLYHYGIVKISTFKHNPAAAIELLKSQPALYKEIKGHSSFWHNNASISQLRFILKSGLIEMPASFKLKIARLINVCLNQ